MKPAAVKSILRVGSTRSLDCAIDEMTSNSSKSADDEAKSSLRGGRRSLKRAVSFSVPSRWQEGSSSSTESDCSKSNPKPTNSPRGMGLRMPMRRTDDDDDNSSCVSNSSNSPDKGLRMPRRIADPEEEECSATSNVSRTNPTDNEPRCPKRKPTSKKTAVLRVPARRTFSGDKDEAVEMSKRPFAARRSSSFNTTPRKPQHMARAGIVSTDGIPMEQMQNQSVAPITA